MTLDRSVIERLVPQTGAMCFLDSVTHWDAHSISCSAPAPDENHPLLRSGKVPAITAAEYAAQATALHGALLDTATTPRAGMLAKLSDVEVHRAWFPTDERRLSVQATLISRTLGGCLYSFDVASAHQPIASGRLMVVFTPTAER